MLRAMNTIAFMIFVYTNKLRYSYSFYRSVHVLSGQGSVVQMFHKI